MVLLYRLREVYNTNMCMCLARTLCSAVVLQSSLVKVVFDRRCFQFTCEWFCIPYICTAVGDIEVPFVSQ